MNKQEYYAYVKNTTASIRLNLKGGIAKDVAEYAIRNNISNSKSAFYLILIALKYNFDSNGNYIPSKLSRSKPCEERDDNIVLSKLNVHFPLNYIGFFETCGNDLSCCTHNATAKKLIAIALDHDFNDSLKFSRPQPCDYSAYKDNSTNDFICLDFI